jgi:hypothetical protein
LDSVRSTGIPFDAADVHRIVFAPCAAVGDAPSWAPDPSGAAAVSQVPIVISWGRALNDEDRLGDHEKDQQAAA